MAPPLLSFPSFPRPTVLANPWEARMYRPAVFSALLSLAVMTTAQTQPAPSANPSRDSAIRIIEQIKRADYEGDRAALKRLHERTHSRTRQQDSWPPANSTGEASPSGAAPSTASTRLQRRKTWKTT